MDSKLGAFLITCAQICTILAVPPCVCPGYFEPVCGSDGITYHNQCRLACRGAIKVKDGRCESPAPPDEPCICTDGYKPVCGTDDRTYPNSCELECEKKKYDPTLSLKRPGACELSKPSCICPLIYVPVCGNDGKTYSSECTLNCATKDNPMLRISHRGLCEDKVKVVY